MSLLDDFVSSNEFLQSSSEHMKIFERISSLSDDYYRVPHIEAMHRMLCIPRRYFFKIVAELKSNSAWPFETSSMQIGGDQSQENLDDRIRAARKAKEKKCGEIIDVIDIEEFL